MIIFEPILGPNLGPKMVAFCYWCFSLHFWKAFCGRDPFFEGCLTRKCAFPKSWIENLGRFWAPKWTPKVPRLNWKNQTKTTTKKGYQNEGFWGPTSAPKNLDFFILGWYLEPGSSFLLQNGVVVSKLPLGTHFCAAKAPTLTLHGYPQGRSSGWAFAAVAMRLTNEIRLERYFRSGKRAKSAKQTQWFHNQMPRHWGDGGASPQGVFDNNDRPPLLFKRKWQASITI